MDVTVSIDQINQALKDYPLGQKPTELYQPVKYLLTLDTNRFYPLLTLWSCYLVSGEHQKAITPALGVEVFFNFLMVHSDLLDHNRQRNGQESVHTKWNQNVAILSGDAMIFKAYELLIQVKPEQIKPVVNNFNRCFTRVCEGKQLALNQPKNQDNLNILEMNPGALGEFSMWLGSLIGGASEEQQAQAGKMGTAIAVSHSISPSVLQSLNPTILQSLTRLDCDQSRKQQFRQWLTSQDDK